MTDLCDQLADFEAAARRLLSPAHAPRSRPCPARPLPPRSVRQRPRPLQLLLRDALEAAARQRWHREHKEVVTRQTASDIQ